MKLGEVLKEWRWARRFTVRQTAKVLDISAATLSRFERGETCDAKTLSKILCWLLSEPFQVVGPGTLLFKKKNRTK